MAAEGKIYAVLTGDLVESSGLAATNLKQLTQELRDGAERFAQRFPGSVFGRLDVFSGDSWQLVLEDPGQALRSALFLRAVVKSNGEMNTDTRVAVAWGKVDAANLNPERVSESTGEAFTQSGRLLADLPKDRRLGLMSPDRATEPSLRDAAVRLLDRLVAGWTSVQAECMAQALLGSTQSGIAERLGKGQSTVNKSLRKAGLNDVEAFLAAFVIAPEGDN